MNSPKDYLTDRVAEFNKRFTDKWNNGVAVVYPIKEGVSEIIPAEVMIAFLTETITQSMEVGRNEREKEIIKKIEKYFEGLIIIPNPQLTKDSLIKFLSPKL